MCLNHEFSYDFVLFCNVFQTQGTAVKNSLAILIFFCFWAISCSQYDYVLVPDKLHYWGENRVEGKYYCS